MALDVTHNIDYEQPQHYAMQFGGASVSTIRSGNWSTGRCLVIHAESLKCTSHGTIARCEIDSHADACVVGPSFMVLEFAGKQCDMTPSTTDYRPIINVPVVNAVGTAFVPEESMEETMILDL